MNLPYLTAELPGIGGQIKAEPEDFFVEEIPLYQPQGDGQHVYAFIEKRGMSTFAAMRKIAAALNISSGNIGYAGLKDAHAVTRQMLSINLVSTEVVSRLNIPNIKILSVSRHRNKLKTGHLTGNRFVIRVRDVQPELLVQAKQTLAQLTKNGAPNFFGEQRFGLRENTDRLGQAIVRNDAAQFVREYLGKPHPNESLHIQAVREHIDQQEWTVALNNWPPELHDEKQVLRAIVNHGGDPDVSLKVLNKKLRSLFVSAFQSRLFNTLLVDRLPDLSLLETGDIAYIHSKGAVFRVDDVTAEQPRADRFEISPAGPLFGAKTVLAEGVPGERENKLLALHQLSTEAFKQVPGMKIRGARRPYRFPIKEPEAWWDEGIMVSFVLPPGTYATTVMAEIMKPSPQESN
jgi:tRNA pseudouridine13 synthase